MHNLAENIKFSTAGMAASPEGEILSYLASVDWNFKGAITNDVTHGFHPYPARFIPQIPRTLIDAFTRPGDVVYDPFVGCGTTCVEANISGRHAVGNDINPLAVLIAKAKTTPISETAFFAAKNLILTLNSHLPLTAGMEPVDVPVSSADWFEEFVAAEISLIKREINKLNEASLRDLCFVALSSIIVSVSRQDSDTRYVRVPKNIEAGDTVRRFSRQLEKMLRKMLKEKSHIESGHTLVKVADSRKPNIFPRHSADFAVTSPPYPNAYDYHLYHRHRLFWLGMDPHHLKNNEIGAHAHYSKKNGLKRSDFMADIGQVLNVTGDILKPGGYFVIVVGNSILHGERIDNSHLIQEASTDSPFVPVAQFERTIDKTKKSFNPSHGNIFKEKVLILRHAR